MKNFIKQSWFIVVIIIIIAVAWYFYSNKEKWQGFYYPDGCLTCEDKYIFSNIFEKESNCHRWAYQLKLSRNNPNDLYECGLNCKKNDYGSYVCKKTTDEPNIELGNF